jgi:nucleotide-binding universal stress UspA family protein
MTTSVAVIVYAPGLGATAVQFWANEEPNRHESKFDDAACKRKMSEVIFRKILCAYDGSEQAFDAFRLALAVAKQRDSELHVVSVGEVEHLPLFVQDVREQKAMAAHRLQGLLFHARSLTSESNLIIHTHALAGRPVRVIVRLAGELNVDLLVIGTRVHSAFYEWLVGSRAAQIMQLALCPVLVVKHGRRRRKVSDKLRYWFDWNQMGAAADSG